MSRPKCSAPPLAPAPPRGCPGTTLESHLYALIARGYCPVCTLTREAVKALAA